MNLIPTITEDMVQVFQAAARKQIASLDASLREVEATPGVWPGHKDQACDIVHNLKGQGASFGYPLITAIAQSLLKLLRSLAEADARAMKIALAHVNALRTILDKDIRGEGGPAGGSLVARLQALSEQAA